MFFLLTFSALAPRAKAVQPETRITAEIDDGVLTTLTGNVHPLASAQNDQGAAPANLPMNSMVLVLRRSASQQAGLDALAKSQQDPASPEFHRWLTPQQFGAQFGAADADLQKVISWLQSQGFTIDHVANGKNFIEFSGTAGQVQQAFHTQIHKYVVNGISHWANATDPQIPSALTPVVAGVATLHNFLKKPQLVKSPEAFKAPAGSGSGPEFTSGGTHALAPADLATIYNINPLYQHGINGNGVKIAVVARSNIRNPSDISAFRSNFGLPANPPNIIVNGLDPGVVSSDCPQNDESCEEAEAVLDTSWAGAVATNATVDLVISATQNGTDGVDLSEMYIIDNNLADVMTESFGDCEANYTAAQANAISALAQQATVQGITYLVASGDSGAEGCDDPSHPPATHPVSVNVLASTPYTLAVGGTLFNENGDDSAYWSATNGNNNESALSYIPENVWNESCAGVCGPGSGLWASGGGVSVFFPKPSWQNALTPSNTSGRNVPDVALTAAGHDAYLICLDGSCTPNATGTIRFEGYSGTSAATPSFAGIIALIVQQTGSRQGLVNPTLYNLAAQEDFSACNGSNTSSLPASNCLFNDITSGNNAVPGEVGYGTPTAQYQAAAGYDAATGLGSVNVTNLVYAFAGAVPPQTPGVTGNAGFTSPASDNSIVTGLTTFSGWALSQTSTIASVTVLIDGDPVGQAQYGISSPAVCATFSGAPGCPNVGWSYLFDTTTLADGSHTLELQAASVLGQYSAVSTTFTVANWTTSNPMTVSIDSPSQNGSPLSGTVNLGGWAIDNISGIGQVAVAIDGISYGKASYGGPRADVCSAYPGRSGCPNVGWNFTLDTTLLADGTHVLTVTPTSAGGQSSTASRTFQISNSGDSSITLFLDRPGNSGGNFTGPVTLYGWAFDNNAVISSVAIAIDGVSYGNAQYGVQRLDVCAVFPGRPGCPNVGWSLVLDTTRLSNGTHTLDVTATGTRHATQSQQFTVSNTTPGNPVTAFIDTPGPLTSIVQGVVQFKGWAISNDAKITTVSLAIDGVPKGVGNYGSPRPDACAAFPQAVCPNGDVGWTLTFDTNQLADGQHTLVVTAAVTDSNGNLVEQGSASSSFTVANWTTADPIRISIDVPNGSDSFSGTAAFGGWAIDSLAAISTISVAIDGTPYGTAMYGAARTDVCAVYSGSPGCPNVGWNFGIDTTLLADGMHTLQITATSAGGQSSAMTQSFQVSNSGTDSVKVNIDNPSAGGSLTGIVSIYGWALDTNRMPIQSVQVLVDGAPNGSGTYGFSRPDVCQLYPSGGGCPNVGWNYTLDTTTFANGLHTLQVRATGVNGTAFTASQSFFVANSQ
ncbi:MAG: hypothetical protein JO319_00495 [Acidobacteriaceae bacterium]|nr:hypothetical protein [Acidobacteriaceae bacterium]